MITNKFKKKTTFLLITILTCINLYSQDNYVFFGSYNWDKTTNGIYVYQLDTINGRLKKITTVRNIANPSFLTLSPNGKYLYACTESKTPDAGSVSSFEFNPEKKTLNFMNSQKSGGENPVYVTVHKNGRWLINGNYTEGSVSVFPIAEDGKIEPIAQNFQYTEGSVNPKRQDRSHIHSTIFSPNYDYIFFPDLGADKIRCYQFDSNQSQPLQTTENPFEKAPLGSGPRHFTFHPNGKFGYCIEELSGTISAYKYINGKLDAFQRINTHPETLKNNFESSDIHISPDGKFLYASNRGLENNIAIFSITEDGILKNIGYQSTLGEHPRVFALNPSGSFLIATNTGNGNVIVFKRDKETGLLKKVGKKITIRNVSCVQIKQY
ncbi:MULTISPECIES: lactonase family protein [unclassified Flavobacterium]|uniref:lactonase family protein n=1 Tax=unclassified Flavobacterium TaxID=196869 RepID=UPI000F0CCEC3|nr:MULTISPECIES: lactonase family protein [unclassified Flavobacterium]AYN04716.1 lactonase family protein [Flavobacterium sp. 140616W15]MCD0474714.1 lactonase family protein [Flavobacterium sp. EDS]